MTMASLFQPKEDSNEKIFDILFNEDDISWKNMIFDLVRTEEMNPWDVDIGLIAQKFLDRLKKLKEMNFRISGKVVLAASILLKLKSEKLVEDDIGALDALIASGEAHDEESLLGGDFEFGDMPVDQSLNLTEKPQIFPRTPQPRKRKVSVFDLIDALEKALEVKGRRQAFVSNRPTLTIPDKPYDITLVIKDLLGRITGHFSKSKRKLTFEDLLPSEERHDKVATFIPLLHLDNQRFIDLLQEAHFSEIEIKLLQKEASSLAKPE